MCAYLGMLQYIFLHHMNCERVVQCGVSPVSVQRFGCNLVGFHIAYKINAPLQKQIHSAANIEKKNKKHRFIRKKIEFVESLTNKCLLSLPHEQIVVLSSKTAVIIDDIHYLSQ